MTHLKISRFFLLFIVLTLVVACSPSPTESNLVENRAIWQSQALENYQYKLSVFCNCPSVFDEPLIVEVQGGVATSISNANSGEEVERKYLANYDTLGKLFDVIQHAIDANADEISVKYNLNYSYPTNISIDYDLDGIDDEVGYTISDFEIR